MLDRSKGCHGTNLCVLWSCGKPSLFLLPSLLLFRRLKPCLPNKSYFFLQDSAPCLYMKKILICCSGSQSLLLYHCTLLSASVSLGHAHNFVRQEIHITTLWLLVHVSPFHMFFTQGLIDKAPTVSSRTPTLDRERTDNWTGSPSLRVPEPMHPPSPSLPDLETATSMGSSQTPFRPYPQQRVHSLSAFMTNILSLFSLSGIRSAIRSAIGKLDPVMYKYTKSGSLFLASVLITWVPPSINRVYSIVRPEGSLTYALNVSADLHT